MNMADLLLVTEEEDRVLLEGIKPVVLIYEELIASNVAHSLSFAGGMQLGRIVNKLQQAILAHGGINEEELEDIELLEEMGNCLTGEEQDFLYGIYLIMQPKSE